MKHLFVTMLFCSIMLGPAFSQINTERLRDRARQRTERNVERRIERRIDKQVDKTLDNVEDAIDGKGKSDDK